jgi:hypothetical protein
MDVFTFYGNSDFPNGMGTAEIHNIETLADMLIKEYTKQREPGGLEIELAKSPPPKWLEWLRIDEEKDDVVNLPTQCKANILDFTRLLLHHLGVDISVYRHTSIVDNTTTERLLSVNRIVKPITARLNAWKLASYLLGNLFALGLYSLAISVANKLLMLTYDIVDNGIPDASHSIVFLYNTCAKLVVKWWLPESQCYHRDIQLRPPPEQAPDLWTSKKTRKTIGVCTHKLLRARSNGRCFLSQVRETEVHACDS